jgi:6-phosphofructokinase 1
VQQAVVSYLNGKGLAARGAARGNLPGTDQRHSMAFASTVDLEEAYEVACHAVRVAAEKGSGYMATIVREPGPGYRVRYDQVPLEVVANSERAFPVAWIAPSKTDVTDEFVRYARPLIGEEWLAVPIAGGLQRFARLKPIFAARRLSAYVPQGYRK